MLEYWQKGSKKKGGEEEGEEEERRRRKQQQRKKKTEGKSLKEMLDTKKTTTEIKNAFDKQM